MKSLHIHIALAACWLTIALAIAVATALLGNEETVLGKRRGADLQARRELVSTRDRVRTAVDWQASPPVLRETMRRVGLLPAESPQSVASR